MRAIVEVFRSHHRRMRVFAGLACALLAGLMITVSVLNTRDEAEVDEQLADAPPDAAQIERGAYLARAGNCQSCHTQAGAAPYSGGKGIATPFGVIYPGNLTPDKKTGLGTWNASHFWRALHNGRSKDGRWLYPAFPYQQYALLTREDTDALFSYLKSLPAVEQRNKDHALSFPYNMQTALALWRAMYFNPLRQENVTDKSVQWQRGRYLVEGLGHCAACHSPRNALGAIVSGRELSGGMMLSEKWMAPSLLSMDEAAVMDWSAEDIVRLLREGRNHTAHVSGPMASVVFGSTQHLSDEDLSAMAVYLKSLPSSSTSGKAISRTEMAEARAQIRAEIPAGERAEGQTEKQIDKQTDKQAEKQVMQHGARLYDKHCAECHGDRGEGREEVYPALHGNRSVTMNDTTNLVNVIRQGGFGPVTAQNPRPYGMPPFGHVLSHRELADLITFVRQSWGNQASPVSELEILRGR